MLICSKRSFCTLRLGRTGQNLQILDWFGFFKGKNPDPGWRQPDINHKVNSQNLAGGGYQKLYACISDHDPTFSHVEASTSGFEASSSLAGSLSMLLKYKGFCKIIMKKAKAYRIAKSTSLMLLEILNERGRADDWGFRGNSLWEYSRNKVRLSKSKKWNRIFLNYSLK